MPRLAFLVRPTNRLNALLDAGLLALGVLTQVIAERCVDRCSQPSTDQSERIIPVRVHHDDQPSLVRRPEQQEAGLVLRVVRAHRR